MAQKNSPTHNFEIKNFKEVYDFCLLNQIMDINSFVYKCFKQGFDIEKYGLLNEDSEPKVVEKEVIKYVDREVIKEVPVDKIIEKIVEVPVEIVKEIVVEKEVLREVPIEKVVEKVVNIYDKNSENELLLKIQQLENELSKKDEELDELKRSLDILRHSNEEKPKNDKTQMLQDTLAKLRAESLKKDETIKELQEKINKLNNKQGDTKAIYHQNTNLKNNI